VDSTAGTTPAEETDMTETAATETKTTKGKSKKPVTPKVAKTKTAKAAKPKREKAPKEDLMTFAFRLPKSESAALHKAAGPAGASRTMRALAAAFVNEDRAAFEGLLVEAKKLRA
jgi:hypothetical protein